MILQILQNEIECKKCGCQIYSAHRHDFKSCDCGAVSVDGGMDYFRRVIVGDPDMVIDRSITMHPDIVRACCEIIQQAIDEGKNPLGILCAVERVKRDMVLLDITESHTK